MEKVLFASVDINALGILLEPDARGNAAVIKSMLTPLNVELSRKAFDEQSSSSTADKIRAEPAESNPVLEVGDVLFAINGKLVHEMPHADVLSILHVDAFSTEHISMVVLSFMDPYAYYHEVKAKILRSHAMDDEVLFGKIRQAGGWRGYLPTLPTWSYFTGGSGSSQSPTTSPKRTLRRNNTSSAQYRNASSYTSTSSTASSSRAGDIENTPHCGAAYLKFSAGEFEQALQVYTSILERDPLSHTVRVSRSLCYLRLHEPLAALKDAEMCCALKPEWPMSYLCKGAALDAMGKPVDACIAYVCGLVVDPTNAVLQQRLSDLFAKMNWTYIELDGEQVVGPVASTVMQREEWGPDLLLDRVLLFKDHNQCNKDLFQAKGVTLEPGYRNNSEIVQVRLAPEMGKLELCEVYDQDEIVTLNSTPVRKTEDIHRILDDISKQPTVVRIGIYSGARLAAENLLFGKAGEITHKALSVKRATLFNVYIDRCGTEAANGVYVPQETKNGSYVFENGNGCLLSLEAVRHPLSGDVVHAWFITRGRAVLYTCMLADESQAECFNLGDDNKFVIEMQKQVWRSCVGQKPLPRIHRTSTVPSLSYLTGDDDDDTASILGDNHEPGKPNLEEDWNFDVQILAIKGYGNRALNRKDFDTAMICYDLVEDQIEAFTADAQDAPLSGNAFLDALRETVEYSHKPDVQDLGTSSAGSKLSTKGNNSSTNTSFHSTNGVNGGNNDTQDAHHHVRIKAHPSSLQRILDDAQQSYRHELQLEAQAVYRDVLLKVLISKSQLFLETGRAQKALTYAERVCTTPSSGAARPMGLYVQALALASLGRTSEALQVCTGALDVLSSDQVLAQRFEGLLAELRMQVDDQKSMPGAGNSMLGSSSLSEADPLTATEFSSSVQGVNLTSNGNTVSTADVNASKNTSMIAGHLRERFIHSPGPSAVHKDAGRWAGRRVPVSQLKSGKPANKKDKVRTRVLEISQTSISLASKIQKALHLSKGRLVLCRDDLDGVLLGTVQDSKGASDPDAARSFTLLLKDSNEPVVLRAASRADAESLARVIAAWKAGDLQT